MGTIVQIGRRYYPVGVTFPFAILLFCFAVQLHRWESEGHFPSTGKTIARQLASVRKFLVFFTLVAIVQSNFEWIASHFSELGGGTQSAVLFNANLLMDSVFLGNDDTFLLLRFVFLLSFGLAAFYNFAFKLVVLGFSFPVVFLSRFSSILDRLLLSLFLPLALFLHGQLTFSIFSQFSLN